MELVIINTGWEQESSSLWLLGWLCHKPLEHAALKDENTSLDFGVVLRPAEAVG